MLQWRRHRPRWVGTVVLARNRRTSSEGAAQRPRCPPLGGSGMRTGARMRLAAAINYQQFTECSDKLRKFLEALHASCFRHRHERTQSICAYATTLHGRPENRATAFFLRCRRCILTRNHGPHDGRTTLKSPRRGSWTCLLAVQASEWSRQASEWSRQILAHNSQRNWHD